MMINAITFLLILSLISIYSYQLFTVEKKMIILEQVDDLLNSVLGLRRYEKNIMLQLNENSSDNAREAIEKIENSLEDLSTSITLPTEKKLLLKLKNNFSEYTTIFEHWCAVEGCELTASDQENSFLIREQGQYLVENVTELVRSNRENINLFIKNILFWLTFLPIFIFVIGGVIFFSVVKNILNRLTFLNQATKDLAAGTFKRIPLAKSPDEVSGLIINFNTMVDSLEEKQEELIQSKKMASIGTFSSGIAHEINNPLNNISLSTDTLIEEFDTMDENEIKEILEDIMTQTERASKIVRNLLDFSRAHSSENQPFHIDYVLHKTTDLIANELSIHDIKLKKELPDMLPQVNGDLQKLQQAFLNLIINAEQAMGEHGTITLRAQTTDDDYIRTDIVDNGPGISQDHLDQIFDPFFTTKETGKGTGLGLSIVYGIVKKHNGYIEVASKLGVGTTFSVYLPIYHPEKQNKEQTDS